MNNKCEVVCSKWISSVVMKKPAFMYGKNQKIQKPEKIVVIIL